MQQRDIDDPDDMVARQHRLLRPAVWLLTVFIVVVLLALPILRAVSASSGRGNATAARDARSFVALQFARAVLERRSTRLAEAWAQSGLHAEIDAVVAEMQLRPASQLTDTTAATFRAACPGNDAFDTATECFRAQLTKQDGAVIATLRFTVSIVAGRATVVAVQPGTHADSAVQAPRRSIAGGAGRAARA